MESKTEIQNHAQYMDMEIRLNIERAIEFKLLRDDIKSALKEFHDWYNWRYIMPVEIVLGADYMIIYIEYDITQELESCEEACIEQAKKDMLSEELTEDDIGQGCHDSCMEDIVIDTNTVFSEIRRKLWEVLDKYGFKYDWEDSWEGDIKYLRFLIKF